MESLESNSSISKAHRTIDRPNDITEIYQLSENLQAMLRRQNYLQPTVNIDCLDRGWVLFLGLENCQGVEINGLGQKISFNAHNALFVPEYGIVEWHVPKGSITWVAYASYEAHESLPSEPIVFNWTGEKSFKSVNEIFQVLSQVREYQPAEKKETDSVIAQQAKDILGREILSDVSISKLASRLGVPHSVLTHAFKKCYGISPVEYRKRLRLIRSLKSLVLNNDTATDSCFDSGFSDYSRFYRSFKEFYKAPPSSYLGSNI